MEPVALVLESLLGLFLLLTSCLLVRTILLEAPQPPRALRRMSIVVHMKEDLAKEEREHSDHTEVDAAVMDLKGLEDCGLTSEEIAAMSRLKKWYQAGEGDRAVLLARWECLRRLKLNGKLDV